MNWSFFIPVAVLATSLCIQNVNAEELMRFDFNDASDPTTAVDVSGNGNDGILEGAIYSGPGGGVSGLSDDRAMDLGDFNNGAFLDLNDLALDGAFDTLVDNDQATIGFWLYGNDQQPASQWTFWFGPDRQLGSHAPWGDGTVYFDVAGCCGPNQRIARNIADPSQYSGQWNHFAYVKDVTYTAIYLNGELFHDSGDDEKDPLFDITEATFGADAGGGASHGGLMDDIRIWDEALDGETIKSWVEDIIPPTYVAGRGTIGVDAYEGEQSNWVFGPEEEGVSGWSSRIVTFDESGVQLDNHTIAQEVLEDNDGQPGRGAYRVVDFAGGGGTFPENLPYPNGVNDASQDDFVVEVTADVTIPAGTWTIGFGSDDGGRLQIEGVEFDLSQNNDDFEPDELRFDGNRGHGWTVGSFELDEELTTTIEASFHERGGGDSFEIAIIEDEVIENADPNTGWELLADETLGWSVTTTSAPLVSADLTAAISDGRPLEFDVDGDSGMADQVTVDNPDPNVFTTFLDIDGVTFQIAGTGAFSNGESFTIVDADQIVGTPIITSLDETQTWTFNAATGQLVFGAALAGDYNGNGLLDAGDLDLHASVGIANQDLAYDANGDGIVDVADRVVWTNDLKNTWMGDADLNGVFDSSDFVIVFGAGKFETQAAATWEEGDWNGDMLFDSSDFVAAFSNGGYEMGQQPGGPNPVAEAVPEPSSLVLALFSVLGLVGYARRRNK